MPFKRDGWFGDYEQHDDEEEYKQEAPSLQQWLQNWLDGRTLFNLNEKPAHPVPPPRKLESRPMEIGLDGILLYLGVELQGEE